ncbi:MAG: DUF6265 family protein [Ferruginibacter sp.]
MRKFILLFFLAPVLAFGQLKKANVSQLSFMKGYWELKHAWGDMEEIWSGPMGDNLMCTYRCVDSGRVVFYEFIVVEQTDSVPVMRLRHFKPGSIGWEEKDKPDDYPLISLSKNKAVFERTDKTSRLVYQRKSPVQLLCVLQSLENGKWTDENFLYRLRPNVK